MFSLWAAGARAGAGTTTLSVLQPLPSDELSTRTSYDVAHAVQNSLFDRMNEYEVWGVELFETDIITSTALRCLKTRYPQWKGEYTPEWVSFLNTNEMISYIALGQVRKGSSGSGLQIHYELWDLTTNHQVTEISVDGTDLTSMADKIAAQLLSEFQLYIAQVTEVGGRVCLLNIGPEAVTTGELLIAFAHSHTGSHRPGFPAHGHREEATHLFGNPNYYRFRDTSATLARNHTHPVVRVRSYLEAAGFTTDTVARVPLTTGTRTATDFMTSVTTDEKRLQTLADFYTGRPIGTLEVETFLKPNPYYNLQFAVCRVKEGFVVPGAFVWRKKPGDATPALVPAQAAVPVGGTGPPLGVGAAAGTGAGAGAEAVPGNPNPAAPGEVRGTRPKSEPIRGAPSGVGGAAPAAPLPAIAPK